MTCLSASTRAEITARIERLNTQLTAANDTLDNAATGGILEYRFDSGEGAQRVEYRSMNEMLKIIDWLEARIGALTRRLNGAGLSTMTLRRKIY